MTLFVLERLLTVFFLVCAFALTTVMAHRTKVHAHLTRVIGLGAACALLSWAWWINTDTFSRLNLIAQSLSLILFLVICLSYSAAVMRSQSVIRWAGAFAACILVAAGFILDTLYESRTTDVAFALAAGLLSINFLGHLLRARVNQALLRSPKSRTDNKTWQALLSLLREKPELIGNEHFLDCLRPLSLTDDQARELTEMLTGFEVRIQPSKTEQKVAARTLLSVCAISRKIVRLCALTESVTLDIAQAQEGLHLKLSAKNSRSLSVKDLKCLANLEVDSLQTSADPQTITIVFGYRY